LLVTFILAIAGPAGRLAPEGRQFVHNKERKQKMFGKVKKIFFTGVFGILYISFVAQLVYVLGWVSGIDNKFVWLGVLAMEWLVLIAARYLSKRSSNTAQYNGYGRRR